eukprot:CAMPEP_0113729188 /NCGR_PEP_ID=MMETSP0038_2-20120614/42387_1 /TAXON_ID=2898 /ORGANISM="Cryptomonas paramecium" /LENGTH=67 /DNA_ID=CAMNT_0000660955 /DNA_START=436 /DNA_END=639 /DNA_ORIENTATION=+ /assembly_acc=CAM_ASM_000170
MNPARTLGPAVAFGHLAHILEYVFATTLAGIAAALAYRGLLGLEEAEEGGSAPPTPIRAVAGQQKYV